MYVCVITNNKVSKRKLNNVVLFRPSDRENYDQPDKLSKVDLLSFEENHSPNRIEIKNQDQEQSNNFEKDQLKKPERVSDQTEASLSLIELNTHTRRDNEKVDEGNDNDNNDDDDDANLKKIEATASIPTLDKVDDNIELEQPSDSVEKRTRRSGSPEDHSLKDQESVTTSTSVSSSDIEPFNSGEKRSRTNFTQSQLDQLEMAFSESQYPNLKNR